MVLAYFEISFEEVSSGFFGLEEVVMGMAVDET